MVGGEEALAFADAVALLEGRSPKWAPAEALELFAACAAHRCPRCRGRPTRRPGDLIAAGPQARLNTAPNKRPDGIDVLWAYAREDEFPAT